MEWLYAMPRSYPCQSREPHLDANAVDALRRFAYSHEHMPVLDVALDAGLRLGDMYDLTMRRTM
jgi:hypothetical protein